MHCCHLVHSTQVHLGAPGGHYVWDSCCHRGEGGIQGMAHPRVGFDIKISLAMMITHFPYINHILFILFIFHLLSHLSHLNTLPIMIIFPSYHQNISFNFLNRDQALFGHFGQRLHSPKEIQTEWYWSWLWSKMFATIFSC